MVPNMSVDISICINQTTPVTPLIKCEATAAVSSDRSARQSAGSPTRHMESERRRVIERKKETERGILKIDVSLLPSFGSVLCLALLTSEFSRAHPSP